MAPLTLAGAGRITVKIGSALLVDRGSGRLNAGWLAGLVGDVAMLRGQGADVILVSSGSIALGRAALGLTADLALEQAQAAAAVGQIRLARAYEEALAAHGLTAGQVLLTLEDSADRRRYLNTRATLGTLLGAGAVPIVNENDTVATDEIRYGDNDRLAANVAMMAGADVLVLLSDVDGFYDRPPGSPGATRFDVIDRITPAIEAMAGDAGSGLSRGGMKTKLMAARVATGAGCAMVITQGAVDRPLSGLIAGAPATWFRPEADPQTARKRWIAAMKTRGVVHLDAGAARALGQGRSLLPAGVARVEGAFGRGDPVAIAGPEARLGTGLVRYTSEEARRIAGQRSDAIEAILGYTGRAVLIHRDDMALTAPVA